MLIYCKDIVDEKFIRIIPKFIIKRIMDLIHENYYKVMQDYLKDNFDVTLEEVIVQLASKGFSYSKVKDLLIIRINDNIKEEKSQEKLSMLVRLIDYGNREIRGINLINSSIDYIRENILNIYRICQMKGGE